MAHPIFDTIAEKNLSLKTKKIDKENKRMEKVYHLLDLYDDSDWMLQAGLGDMEFEQDLYDDIRYGKPGYSGWFPGKSNFPDYSYDKFGLNALRHHAQQGPKRWMNRWPYREKNLMDYIEPTLGWYNPYYKNIGLNVDNISGFFNMGNLQNKISDVARHEIKHSYMQPRKDITPSEQHDAIYGSGLQYNLSGDVFDTLSHMIETPWSNKRSQQASSIVQEMSNPPGDFTTPDRTQGPGRHHFNTGGIVSLML